MVKFYEQIGAELSVFRTEQLECQWNRTLHFCETNLGDPVSTYAPTKEQRLLSPTHMRNAAVSLIEGVYGKPCQNPRPGQSRSCARRGTRQAARPTTRVQRGRSQSSCGPSSREGNSGDSVRTWNRSQCCPAHYCSGDIHEIVVTRLKHLRMDRFLIALGRKYTRRTSTHRRRRSHHPYP